MISKKVRRGDKVLYFYFLPLVSTDGTIFKVQTTSKMGKFLCYVTFCLDIELCACLPTLWSFAYSNHSKFNGQTKNAPGTRTFQFGGNFYVTMQFFQFFHWVATRSKNNVEENQSFQKGNYQQLTNQTKLIDYQTHGYRPNERTSF